MNKYTFLGLVFALFLSSIQLQAEGIQFQKSNWNETVALAKQQKKLIYLDIYTSWCGPCKIMAKRFFNDEEVGEFYNKNFISYSVDAEKGEGLEIAYTYEVKGYPTNLFIDPNNKKVVYKTMGCPDVKANFIKNGQTALLEYQDPMTLSQYETKFTSGQYDEKFLKKYLIKCHRIAKNNDEPLNAYVAKFGSAKPKDSVVNFLSSVNQSANNKAFDFIMKESSSFKEKKNKGDKLNYMEEMLYKSVEYATEKKQDSYFDQAIQKFSSLYPEEIQKKLMYQYNYYGKSTDANKKWNACAEYAGYLVNKSNEQYTKENKEELEKTKEYIRLQLKEMKVPEADMDNKVDENIKRNVRMQYGASLRASNELNAIAWDVFEHSQKDASKIQKAADWASKGVDLAATSAEDQLAVMDTYASLLYVLGKKEEAIRKEEEAVALAKKISSESLESFEKTLLSMKEGKFPQPE